MNELVKSAAYFHYKEAKEDWYSKLSTAFGNIWQDPQKRWALALGLLGTGLGGLGKGFRGGLFGGLAGTGLGLASPYIYNWARKQWPDSVPKLQTFENGIM